MKQTVTGTLNFSHRGNRMVGFVHRVVRLLFIPALLCSVRLFAVISTTGGTASTSIGSTNVAGWNYVGSISGASGVYLGNYSSGYWVLTAAHVGSGSFTLGGYIYTYVSGTAVNFQNADSSYSDLTLYSITSTNTAALDALDALTNLNLSSSYMPLYTQVTLVGNGGGKSWGTNYNLGIADYTLENGHGGNGYVTFDENGVGVTGGDSGGGMFTTGLNGVVTLTGIISAKATFTLSDSNTTTGAIAVTVADYYTQIMAVINSTSAVPEPASAALLIALGGCGLMVVRRPRVTSGRNRLF